MYVLNIEKALTTFIKKHASLNDIFVLTTTNSTVVLACVLGSKKESHHPCASLQFSVDFDHW